mmetsp:Transcript_34696/g.49255  ORF Transcript_34696/g.49255 Transcript_34696/m.49255 type:complete len:242 (-) Transcript_34696:1237-1962(-)
MADKSKQMKTILVVGATGATGRFVVQMLLDKGQKVQIIARSKERMMEMLRKDNYDDRLIVKEGAILDVPDDELKDIVFGCDAVISCLGHRKIWAEPRLLVTDAMTRLTQAADKSQMTKFILMGSNGVANPNGKDDIRPYTERFLIQVIRWLVPPHVDNEKAAAYLYNMERGSVEWTVMRPDDLIDADVSSYQLLEKPCKGLFGGGVATRANVADAMVSLALDKDLWNQWKFQMPVLNDGGA